jgi:hypothetical protein
MKLAPRKLEHLRHEKKPIDGTVRVESGQDLVGASNAE